MSAYLITKRKEDGVKVMHPITSRKQYLKLRDSATQKRTVKAVRENEADVKSDLIQMNYSCLPNPDGTLKGTKTKSNSVGMDIDHISPEKMEEMKQRILSKVEELGLQMLEKSARSLGYHLVFKRRPELSQEDNLRWASQLLEVEYDKQAKDITRVFFTTTASDEDLLYLDDALFVNEACDSQDAVTVLQCYSSNDDTSQPSAISPLPSIAYDEKAEYNGILYTDIVEKYWEMFNDGKTPSDGDRNVLTFELAVTLRSICDYSLEKMLKVIPNYWKNPDGTCTQEDLAEWRRTIESALKEPKKGMPYRVRQVLKALKATSGVKACGGTMTTPPPMPKKLPPLLRLLTKNVPWFYKPIVASAVFPALGAHLHGVKFRYWDNVEHEATFMNVLIGRQSIGKGTIKEPINYIMADIKERDEPNRKREAEWKQKNPPGKQKKDPRPADICIQRLIDNLTDAVFNSIPSWTR